MPRLGPGTRAWGTKTQGFGAQRLSSMQESAFCQADVLKKNKGILTAMTQVMNNINKNENPMILAMATIAQSVTSVLGGRGA